MKKFLAILSLALIYAPAFAVNERTFEHANPNASFFNSIPEPETLILFAFACVSVLLLTLIKK